MSYRCQYLWHSFPVHGVPVDKLVLSPQSCLAFSLQAKMVGGHEKSDVQTFLYFFLLYSLATTPRAREELSIILILHYFWHFQIKNCMPKMSGISKLSSHKWFLVDLHFINGITTRTHLTMLWAKKVSRLIFTLISTIHLGIDWTLSLVKALCI